MNIGQFVITFIDIFRKKAMHIGQFVITFIEILSEKSNGQFFITFIDFFLWKKQWTVCNYIY